jgi:predicted double-glycine peptidase
VAIIATVLGVFLLAAAWRLGPWLADGDRRFIATAVASLITIGAWFAGYQLTYVALRIVPWDDALFFERLPLYASIVLLLSICVRRLDRRLVRLAVGTIAAVFSLYAIAELAAPLPLPHFSGQLSASTEGPPEVMQSTGWSCGAAALAWAARLHGVPASERQMAELAVTAPLRGTSTRGMLRALHHAGLDAYAVRPASREDLAAAPKPVLIGWKLTRTVAHSALVLSIEGDEITVGDPLAGSVTYSYDHFRDRWMCDMIVIIPPDGTPGEPPSSDR